MNQFNFKVMPKVNNLGLERKINDYDKIVNNYKSSDCVGKKALDQLNAIN